MELLENTAYYGLIPTITNATAHAATTNGSAVITIAEADYDLLAVGSIVMLNNGSWAMAQVVSKGADATPWRVTLDRAWPQGPENKDFAYGTPITLGKVTDVNIEYNSPIEKMGMPIANSKGAILFDTEGVIKSFNIKGFFSDTSDANVSYNVGGRTYRAMEYMLSQIGDGVLTGSQMNGTYAIGFYYQALVENYCGWPIVHFVMAESFNYGRNVKDVCRWDYNLKLVESYRPPPGQ